MAASEEFLSVKLKLDTPFVWCNTRSDEIGASNFSLAMSVEFLSVELKLDTPFVWCNTRSDEIGASNFSLAASVEFLSVKLKLDTPFVWCNDLIKNYNPGVQETFIPQSPPLYLECYFALEQSSGINNFLNVERRKLMLY